MRTAARGATRPSPFDYASRRCDNTGVKTLCVVLALSLAACGKANDVPAIRAEAEGTFQNYKTRLDHLNSRAESIMQRGNAIGVTNPDAANASRLFAMAKGKLEQLRGDIAAAPVELSKIKDRIELIRYFGRTEHALQTGYVEINADFDAVESWITLAESRPTQVSSRQPAVVPPPPSPNPNGPPPPANPGQQGAGGTTPTPPR
jgi:hypothetical protein